MEKDFRTTKELEWGTIVEYFTKRGRPISKEELERYKEEDLAIEEEKLQKAKRLEEEDRKRDQDFMANMEYDDDIDETIRRQELQERALLRDRERFKVSNDDGYVSDPETQTANRDYDFYG